MKYCVVKNSKTNSKMKIKKSIFKVPNNVERRKKWEAVIPGISVLDNSKFICENHFKAEDIVIAVATLQRRQLRKTAVIFVVLCSFVQATAAEWMANKTPVMILQEFMVKRKGTLEFNLTRQSGGTHDPVFEFAVRANPVTAIGIGRSKKEAKHDAAKNALKELAELGLYSPDNEYGYLHSSPRRDSPDSFDKFQVNFVGQLKEFCAEKRLPDPKFDIISDIGPPHARKFTMSCSVASVKCTATQNTKKLAKQSVSKKMLQCLIDTVDCGGIIVPYEELSTCDQEAMDKRDECKGQPTVNLSRRICDYPHSFHELDVELLSNAKAILESGKEESIEKKLENALNALEITYSVEELPSAVSNKFGMSVKIQSDPYYEIPAFGLSKEEAEQSAVNDAINFLKIMLK